VEVHLVEDGGLRLYGRLERGDVHLTLTAVSGRFESRLLYPMHALAALSPTHRLARRAALEIAELADEPLLLLGRDFGSREWFDAACSVAHIRPRVLLESAAPHTLIALAATGYGIAIIPRMRKCLAALFAPCRWFIAGHRSEGGRRLRGIRNGSWRHTPSSSSRRSSPTAAATILAAISSGALRCCPGQRKRTLILIDPDSTKSLAPLCGIGFRLTYNTNLVYLLIIKNCV
jgi:hypothetical protein